jgi:hypothetical protein
VWAYALGVTNVVPEIHDSSTSYSVSQTRVTPETKLCPFCAEEIKKDARKCKHCHSDLSDDAILKGVQSDELVRQRETLEKKRQEIEKMMALEAEREKLEAERFWEAAKKKQLTNIVSPAYSTAKEIGRNGRFIAYNDGTALDTKTNLMWAGKDNGSDINWQDAKSYCENYRGGNYTDWRMPTLNELSSLYDRCKTNRHGACVIDLIEITELYVWASETGDHVSAYFRFGSGTWDWSHQSNGNKSRALPVRFGK